RIAPEKGSALLGKVLPVIGKFADVLLVGSGLEGQGLGDMEGVQVISRYHPEDLPKIMREFQPHLGMLLSDFPETFSYTLDELLVLGIPPVAVRIGALADRIHEGKNGFLVENNPHSVVQMLENLDHNRERLLRVRHGLETANIRTEADMIRDYEFLLNLPRFSCRAIDARNSLPLSTYSYVLPSMHSQATASSTEAVYNLESESGDANGSNSRWHSFTRNLRNGLSRPRRRRLEPLQYDKLISRIRQTADAQLPAKAIVAVVTKGDEQLLRLHKQRACHFPQVRGGVYAGHHPANSAEAISHIEALRSRGVEFLLFPKTSFWWFEHYLEFKQFLDSNYKQLVFEENACMIYSLFGFNESGDIQESEGNHENVATQHITATRSEIDN
ncbi:MAG TPA: hypothetical protein VLK33_22800, partial [Terriglobales bacterium]|nr:hypothetical protein [Terriglobales bacterium]